MRRTRITGWWPAALVVALLVAAGGSGLSVSVAASGEEAPGEVAPDADVDPSQTPAEDAEIEDTTPVPPSIFVIPLEDASNIPFPSGFIGGTSGYYESDGHLVRAIYAGGAGCMYGRPDGSDCAPKGSTDYQRVGMIVETLDDLDGVGPLADPPASPPRHRPDYVHTN